MNNIRKEFIDSTGINASKLRQIAADEKERKRLKEEEEVRKQIALIDSAYELLIKEISELLEKFRETNATEYKDSIGNRDKVVYNSVSNSLLISIKFSTGLREMLEKIELYNEYTIPKENELRAKLLKIFETYTIETLNGTGDFEFDLDPRLL